MSDMEAILSLGVLDANEADGIDRIDASLLEFKPPVYLWRVVFVPRGPGVSEQRCICVHAASFAQAERTASEAYRCQYGGAGMVAEIKIIAPNKYDMDGYPPAKGYAHIDDVIAYLNDLLALDRPAIAAMVANRVPCNEQMVSHSSAWAESQHGGYHIGLLGILNGVFHCHPSYRSISFVFEDGDLARFARGDEIPY